MGVKKSHTVQGLSVTYHHKSFIPVVALIVPFAVAVVADAAKFVAVPEFDAVPVSSIPLVEAPREHSAPAGHMTARGDFSEKLPLAPPRMHPGWPLMLWET